MNREFSGKLIRDKIPKIAEAKGETLTTKVLEESERLPALLDKLLEESQEVKDSEGDVEELADVYEVLLAIIQEKGMNIADVEQARLKKLNQRGGFKIGIFLEK